VATVTPLTDEAQVVANERFDRRWMRASAPGRVNLIGDHTDYSGGLALPLAVNLATEVRIRPAEGDLRLTSSDDPAPAVVGIPASADPARLSRTRPAWARFVAAAAAVAARRSGGVGTVTTELPIGAGLSSSAALVVALLLALGLRKSPRDLALCAQRAEQAATGVNCGLMDQLTATEAVAGHGLLIDFRSLKVSPIPIPDAMEVVVAHSGEARRLATSAYDERRAQAEEAARQLGPLAAATLSELGAVHDPAVRRSARHAISENGRVREAAVALRDNDPRQLGQLMNESHVSLRKNLGVSTPALDGLVSRLQRAPGVLGARLTGAGFGGCAVAVAERGTSDELRQRIGSPIWVVQASGPAFVEEGVANPGTQGRGNSFGPGDLWGASRPPGLPRDDRAARLAWPRTPPGL
jgi:galactokinase